MKLRNVMAAVAAVTVASAPAVAQVSLDRAAAPVEAESELGGNGGSAVIIGVLSVAAIIAGILIASDVFEDDDDGAPVSP